MTKIVKKSLIGVLVLCYMFAMSGCSLLYDFVSTEVGELVAQEVQFEPQIGLATEQNKDDPDLYPASRFTHSVSPYAQYRSSLFFDRLSENGKMVYRAFEVALEKGYTDIYIDDRLVQDIDELTDILIYLSLDSPLLEQNLRYKSGTFTLPYDVSLWDLIPYQTVFDGYYISVENFRPQWLDKKKEALKKAEEIIAQVPQDLSELDKAAWLYRYLAEHTTYESYSETFDNTTVYAYLYDALIVGKTQCDGFANALSLLLRLSGIECVEKLYNTYEEGQEGHTWNTFAVDGVWYNADATDSDMIPSDPSVHCGMGFGFPDVLQTYTVEYEDAYADCTQSAYMPVDAHLADASEEPFVKAVQDGYDLHGDMWALVVLDSCEKEQLSDTMQAVADALGREIWYISYNCRDGRTSVLVYDNALYGE